MTIPCCLSSRRNNSIKGMVNNVNARPIQTNIFEDRRSYVRSARDVQYLSLKGAAQPGEIEAGNKS